MTLTRELMMEPAGAVRLRQVAPWLVLLGLGALLLLPGILFDQRPTGNLRHLSESSMTEVIALSRHEIKSER